MTTTQTEEAIQTAFRKELVRLTRSRQPHPAYFAIVERCVELGLPHAYSDDVLKHDRRTLEQDDPPEFFWAVYEHGSHIVIFDNAHMSPLMKQIAKSSPNVQMHWWDSQQLLHVTAINYAIERLKRAIAHQKKLGKDRWRRPPLPPGTCIKQWRDSRHGGPREGVISKPTKTAPDNVPMACNCGQHEPWTTWHYPISNSIGRVCQSRLLFRTGNDDQIYYELVKD